MMHFFFFFLQKHVSANSDLNKRSVAPPQIISTHDMSCVPLHITYNNHGMRLLGVF